MNSLNVQRAPTRSFSAQGVLFPLARDEMSTWNSMGRMAQDISIMVMTLKSETSVSERSVGRCVKTSVLSFMMIAKVEKKTVAPRALSTSCLAPHLSSSLLTTKTSKLLLTLNTKAERTTAMTPNLTFSTVTSLRTTIYLMVTGSSDTSASLTWLQ